MKKKIKLVIVAGGTGGHVIPAINIYKELIKINFKIYLFTNKSGLIYIKKNKEINDKNIKIIDIKNFKSLNFIKKIFYIFKFLKCIFVSILSLKKIKPDIVLGMGSYSTIPTCLSSWFLKIPLILHEQNVNVGLSNKILSIFSKKLLRGFNKKKFSSYKSIFTGNPINKSILKIKNFSENIKKRKGLINLLILGGSQGSSFINNLIINALTEIKNKFNIWHQVGVNDFNYIKYKYKNMKFIKIYKIEKFINNMSKAYLWSDLLISRSGASIVSEVYYIKIPSIFIPYPHKNRHQYFNAINLEKIGLSKIIIQSNNSIKEIINILKSIDRNILYNMSNNVHYNNRINKHSIKRIKKEIIKNVKN